MRHLLAFRVEGVWSQLQLSPNALRGLRLRITADNLLDVLVNLLNFFLLFAGIIAFLYVLYGGFLYLTAGGDDAKVEKARRLIVQVIIGVVIIFLSFSLVSYLLNVLTEGLPAVTY